MKISRFVKLGVSSNMDLELRRVTMLANGVYLIVGGIVGLFLLLNIQNYLTGAGYHFIGFVPVIIFVVASTALLLNYLQWYLFSRIVFVSAWILFTCVLIPLVLGSTSRDYIVLPWYAIVASLLVQIVFSYHREKWVFWSFFLVTSLLIIFFIDFIKFFMVAEELVPRVEVGKGWRINIYMFATFFNAAVAYVIWLNRQFYDQVQRQNHTIRQQHDQLVAQHQELEVLSRSLEDKVVARTQRLRAQNVQLTEYAHFNSHILRAPVSRIRGLLNLLQMSSDPAEEKRIRALLGTCMLELDEAIRAINHKLDHQPNEDLL